MQHKETQAEFFVGGKTRWPMLSRKSGNRDVTMSLIESLGNMNGIYGSGVHAAYAKGRS